MDTVDKVSEIMPTLTKSVFLKDSCRCYELVRLKRKHLTIDPTMVDYVLEKYLANEPLMLSDKSTYFWVHLANRKGWQCKVDKGMTEGDLRCKSIHYPISSIHQSIDY